MGEWTRRDTLEILKDWGGSIRGKVGPLELLHGFPSCSPIERMRQQTGPAGTDDGTRLTPPENAIEKLHNRERMMLQADQLIRDMKVIPMMALVFRYRDKLNSDEAAEKMGSSAANVREQSQRAEDRVHAALIAGPWVAEALRRKRVDRGQSLAA